MQREPLVYLDGGFVPKSEAKVSVFDHGLLYGDGVFEGIRAFDGYVFKLVEHVDRLYESARCLELDIPMSKEAMADTVVETLRRNNLTSAYIRLVVTRGAGDMGVNPSLCKKSTVFVIAESMATGFSKEPRVLSSIITSVRRDSVDATTHEIKSLNYLNSVLAVIEANRAKVDYPIMLDRRGFVSEGSTMNIFLVKNGNVLTPSPSSGILHGITRARLIGLCRELKYSVTERDITPFELFTADEAFFTGTLLGLASIGEVNGKKIGSGGVGPVTRELYDHFKEIVSRPEEGTPVLRQIGARAAKKK
ncbi:MAG: branched-chain-amino-acid transaminase [Nitrososphaerota archaeon]|nr:branched-chain-amino-acid transaminase [Nitrososphaerota archaeon]